MESVNEILLGLFILGMVSGVIPGLAFLIIYSLTRGAVRTGKKIASTDYAKIPKDEERKRLLEALAEPREVT